MTSVQAALQVKNSMNKLDSKDYPNIELWKIQEAVNTATQRFVRRRLPRKESTSDIVEDIEILIKVIRLSGSNRDTYFLSHKLPSDYFGLSRMTPICDKGICLGVKITSDWIEDSNIDKYLTDWSSQPSFEFEQSFHTLSGGKIKSYHNKEFTIKELELSYYRQPQYIQFPGALQPDGVSIGKDMIWEWKDDIADMIIEEAVWVLSGNTGDYNRNQIASQAITTK